MFKILSIPMVLLLLPALLFHQLPAFAAAPRFSYNKIEKYYDLGKYQKVLRQIKKLEEKRYGIDGHLKYTLRNDLQYYHYKLSARLQLNQLGSLKELVGLYDRLLTLDSASQYLSLPQYQIFREYIKKVSETTLKAKQIAITKTYVKVLARQGDTTWVYRIVFPTKEMLDQARKEALRVKLKRYNYYDIDKQALAVKKQPTMKSQVMALIKDYTHDFQKVRGIYIWKVNNISYDYSYSIYDGPTTFRKNTGVCSGFSYLFQEMCQLAGIKAHRITGLANNGLQVGGHAWNSVELDGHQLLIESTWASCVKDKTAYYYLISEKQLALTHKEDETE